MAATLTGRQILRLAKWRGISAITPDTTLRSTGYENAEMWRQTSNLQQLSVPPGTGPLPQAPAIAIIDSGIDATRSADFGSRVVASVNVSSRAPGATGDQQGHGTMVAGIAAGASALYPGGAPNAQLVDVRTADGNGESLASDVIAGIDWILAHRAQYGIRVVNLSMVGNTQTSFLSDPLNKAVERLWFSGIVVVAAAGNNGTGTGEVDMSAAPGNDPFVITVGAIDQAQTSATGDDFVAPWSSYGHTVDGFAKPELSAPGRYLVMPVPPASTIATALPDRVVAPGYMWMSGTSFAAPVVSGAAAQLLARHPDWTPDQVKGALMQTARALTQPQAPVNLGTAAGYAVLAGSTVTSTGPTIVSGDLGLSPGTSVTGFPPGLMNGGVQNVANPAAVQAKSDLVAAYDEAAGQTPATPVVGEHARRADADPRRLQRRGPRPDRNPHARRAGRQRGRLRLPGGVDAHHRVGESGGARQRRLAVQRLLEGRKLGDARHDHELQGNDPRPRVDHGEYRRHGGRPAAGAYRPR